jgi:hypothetical protein
MALLEKVNQMKQSGMTESQIMDSLREQGLSQREISESLSQLKIKDAVYPAEESGMQPSIMEKSSQETMTIQASPSQGYSSQAPANYSYPPVQSQQTAPQYTAPYPAQAQQYPQAQQYDSQYSNQTAYPQDQQYGSYGYDQTYYQQALDVETVREIAKQEVEESTKKIRQEVESLLKLKSELQAQIANLDTRLSRIELTIQELQTAIIKKIGEYGEAISGISEEVKSTQESFSKLINPILDNKRQNILASSESEEKPKVQKNKPNMRKTDSSPGFEEYFR